MSKGFVYLLTNDEIPGVVKIGMTTQSSEYRAAQLNTTGVPGRWEVSADWATPDCRQLEAAAHRALGVFRISDDREFFRCPTLDALRTITDLHREQIEEWLEEFLPDHVPVECDEYVDCATVYRNAADPNLLLPEVPHVLMMLSADELAPAIRRRREYIATRRAERK